MFGISRFAPVHGDDVSPLKRLDPLQTGAGAGIDLLIGTNAQEMNLYFIPTGVREKIGRLLSIYVFHRVHPRARKLLKAYGMGRKGVKPGHAFTDALTGPDPCCKLIEFIYKICGQSGESPRLGPLSFSRRLVTSLSPKLQIRLT